MFVFLVGLLCFLLFLLDFLVFVFLFSPSTLASSSFFLGAVPSFALIFSSFCFVVDLVVRAVIFLSLSGVVLAANLCVFSFLLVLMISGGALSVASSLMSEPLMLAYCSWESSSLSLMWYFLGGVISVRALSAGRALLVGGLFDVMVNFGQSISVSVIVNNRRVAVLLLIIRGTGWVLRRRVCTGMSVVFINFCSFSFLAMVLCVMVKSEVFCISSFSIMFSICNGYEIKK